MLKKTHRDKGASQTMDMEPKKIESMDDLRAAMNDPEIQAASK